MAVTRTGRTGDQHRDHISSGNQLCARIRIVVTCNESDTGPISRVVHSSGHSGGNSAELGDLTLFVFTDRQPRGSRYVMFCYLRVSPVPACGQDLAAGRDQPRKHNVTLTTAIPPVLNKDGENASSFCRRP